MSRDKLGTNSSKSIVKFWHSTKHFDHIKPIAMTKILPLDHTSIFAISASGKTLIRLIFPVEIFYSLLSDGI
jgi:hypothetical protein